jgi:chemotaxis protein methyltransferase CheR
VSDAACVRFLQWALPRMRLHWPGFRRVRGIVCKRVARRLRALGLADLNAYRALLEREPVEWSALEALCAIPVSRFWRDRAVFAALERDVLPELAQAARAAGRATLDCWSAGCAGGEEPWSLAVLWHARLAQRIPWLELRVMATDVDPAQLARAARGCYRASSLKELPRDLSEKAFKRSDGLLCLRPALRGGVEFACRDIRSEPPARSFDLILCRNLVLTYFEPALREQVLQRIIERLRPGGALVVGLHEGLPAGLEASLVPWPGARAVWRST